MSKKFTTAARIAAKKKGRLSKSQKSIGQYGLELDASKLNNFIQKNLMTTNAMFSKPQLNELQKMVNALAFTQGRLKKRAGLPGEIFIQMKQSGSIITLDGDGQDKVDQYNYDDISM